jgi:hypothetical protein
MRENRLYGSEGGVAKAIPTPISHLPRQYAVGAEESLRRGRTKERVGDREKEKKKERMGGP